MVGGDFNEVLYSFEKKGGGPQDENRMEAFKMVLEECNLIDVSFSKVWFTWERGNLPEINIRERLDRGVMNDDWLKLFLDTCVKHSPHSISDHCPLLISNSSNVDRRGSWKFKFEAWWILEDTFKAKVKRIWEGTQGSVFDKLDYLASALMAYAKSV